MNGVCARAAGMVLAVLVLGWAEARAVDWPQETTLVTSVGQVKDVDPKTPGYEQLKELIEKWGVLGTDEKGNFRPDEKLTRGVMVLWLNQSVYTVTQLVSAVADGLDAAGVERAMAAIPDGGVKDADASKIADLKKDDPWYEALTALVNKHHFMPVDEKKNFRGAAEITAAELTALLKTAYGYDAKLAGAGAVTRMEGARHLAAALAHYERTKLAALESKEPAKP